MWRERSRKRCVCDVHRRAQLRSGCKVLELELRFAYAERDLLNVLGQIELRKLLEELLSRLLTEPLLDLL